MIRLQQIKFSEKKSAEQLTNEVARLLRIPMSDIRQMEILRESIDARKKPQLFFIYTVALSFNEEEKWLKKNANRKDLKDKLITGGPEIYHFPSPGNKKLLHRPVVVGMGPAGLFCAYYLAKNGYRPIVIERGKDVDARKKDVEAFWKGGELLPESNVQFGEGGAGTFSDGKLNTLVKDKDGRGRAVMQTFVEHGAKESILYDAKPHIGTDVLSEVVRSMRNAIIAFGGEVKFETKMKGLLLEDTQVKGCLLEDGTILEAKQVVLAIGHSARDTVQNLFDQGISMEAKAFSVGFRVQHPQKMMNLSQYGVEDPGSLGAAPYKVTAKTSSGRGVFSFCMCPGGYVVNASSEKNRLAINGMSYSGRNGENANSAIIISVTPEDYGSDHPLAGISFQRKLEEKAFQAGKGRIPMQRYGVFEKCVKEHMSLNEFLQKEGCSEELLQEKFGLLGFANQMSLEPAMKGEGYWGDLTGILSQECNEAFTEGMSSFAKMIHGFADPEVILAGVESRTSSPVRINRDEQMESNVRGLYPCGEGAGYAGGITSAAMDGMKVAEMIAKEYHPF